MSSTRSSIRSSTLAFAAVVDGLLEEGLSVRFRAGGRSMLPTLRDGEVVTVAPASAADVAVGDVLLCATARGPLAHRLVSVAHARAAAAGAASTLRLTLRGDASLECDAPVTAAQVRGKVVSVERDGRSLSLALRGGALGRGVWLASRRLRPALSFAVRQARQALAPLLAQPTAR
jgi:hypothetical protein